MKNPPSSSHATTESGRHRLPASRCAPVRYALLAVGWLSVALGIAGIFLPLLPTTPFLLLAAACFTRSSPRFYHWLVEHPRLGPWIRNYLDGHGIPFKAKVYAIALLWVSIGVSCWLVPHPWVHRLLPVCALLVSLWIWRYKTLPEHG